MKKLVLLFIVFPFLSFTQISDWYKVDLSRLGYKHNSYNFELIPGKSNTSNHNENFNVLNVKGGSSELSVDIFTRHMFFSLDGSSILDVGITLFQFKEKERWWDNNDYYVLFSDILPVKLAFGTNISKYFGVYLGGQYSLSSLGIDFKNTEKFSAEKLRMGGNAYGVGGHIIGAYSLFNLRYSYTYDWTSQGGYFTGNRINNEIVLSIGFAKVGLFLKYKHSYNMANAGYLPVDRSKLFKSKYENEEFKWQSAQFATKSEFSVGIYGAGLFSKINKIGAQAVGDVEKGLLKERQQDKRRRIEYKEQ
ncbi:hypothetical protein [Brumimicrobium oceani]|uniref:DUF4421 domain-containing protein n=1 Tax=Brumimicrobium oceani TaxID=2100725 RepID=A0A2U2XGE9_9FLAO|nr:hypothetical protein [Brumimicrobium oceani]PWH86878.1 hypothetical protein DIT68_01055 [Brumimicrobium oceani]